MVGSGYLAQFLLEGWQDAGSPCVALCDLDPNPLAALADRFSFRELLPASTRGSVRY